MALAPLEMEYLSELEICRVGREQTIGIGIGFGQVNLGVDVEWEVISARRPHERSNIEVLGDLIAFRCWAIEGGRCGDLWRISGEVVGSELVSSDMSIQLFKPTIVD